MEDRRPTIPQYIDEFYREAMTVAEHATEAAQHYEDGDAASAALVIALSHYKISALDGGRQGLLRLLEERDGVTPDDALKRMP